MLLNVYSATFVVLVLACAFMGLRQRRARLKVSPSDPENRSQSLNGSQSLNASARHFQAIFLPVYLLVMASDWLQGPYIYTLYKDQKHLPERTVALLFATGFISAAVSATFAGAIADRHGRRSACLGFCGIYSVSCLTTFSKSLPILFGGRVLGGLATTLMYSVFESWMVTEYGRRGLEKSDLTLGGMFGLMTTLNGGVAIAAGVFGEAVVRWVENKTAPFLLAIVCLMGAAYLIGTGWDENYGDSKSVPSVTSSKNAYRIIFEDKRILVLGGVAACFEGSMYLFVFYWSAALSAAHWYSASISAFEPTPPRLSLGLPFGIIFATFMCGMMLGSLFFSSSIPYSPSSPHRRRSSSLFSSQPTRSNANLSSPYSTEPSANARKSRVLTSGLLLTGATAAASCALLLAVIIKNETATLFTFVLFEASVGIYFPSMGALRGKLVGDGKRAGVYGVLRVPLNVFVVGALGLTSEGDVHRNRIFLLCGTLLLASSFAAGIYLDDDNSPESEWIPLAVTREE